MALGMWAERRRWGQRLGGPLLLLAGALGASQPFDLVRAANGLANSLVVCALSRWV